MSVFIVEECLCLSTQDPVGFYEDPLSGVCHECPAGCSCSAMGCASCSPNTMRFNYIAKRKSVCPCVGGTVRRGSQCTKCPVGSYTVNGKCVRCRECLDCDITGCTKCSEGMVLEKGRCKCPGGKGWENVESVCMCKYGWYLLRTTDNSIH